MQENNAAASTNRSTRGIVEDKAAKPAGLLPKHTQQLVILGVAVVMVLIMWLTSGAKHAPTAPSAGTQWARIQPPNTAAVEDFKQTIQEEQAAVRQPISPSNLARLQALGLAGEVPRGVPPVPPSGTIPEAGGVIGAGVSQQPSDPVKEDRKKREYLSLFAPNVAFSSRKGQQNEHSAEPAKPLELDSLPLAVAQEPVRQPTMPDVAQANTPLRPPNPEALHPGTFNVFTGKRYVLFEGTVLETLLINRLNGTFAGPVSCLVTTDVYSRDRQHVLIPAGSKLLGEARKLEAFGQQRLAVFFHRLIMPDGYSVNLDQFKGLNQIGETALRDKVNNHYLQIFGASLAVGILGGIAEAGTGNVFTASRLDQARAGVGSSLASSSVGILDHFLNILPTVTIREGTRVKIALSGDLALPDYALHTVPGDI